MTTVKDNKEILSEANNSLLNHILKTIKEKNPRHGKKITKNLENIGDEYYKKSAEFFNKYALFVKGEGKDVDYGVDCYLKMIGIMMYEQVDFFRTGEYSCKSFEEANKAVYSNPEVMESYMHGLLLSQFLWNHHYKVLEFFIEQINSVKGQVNKYLEIGGGHGLYLSEAMEILGTNDIDYHCVDISAGSLEVAKKFVDNPKVSYRQYNIFDYDEAEKYDFITMGEVLEHVEDPVALLEKLGSLLKPDGMTFITTPTNSPAIDHIYLFRNAPEIIEVIHKAGFEIVKDFKIYSEDVSEKRAEKLKVPMMYAALIKKK